MGQTWAELRQFLEAKLGDAGHAEARWILQAAIQRDSLKKVPSEFPFFANQPVPSSVWSWCEGIASQRAAGEPLQYLLGTQSFFGRDFYVGPGVLVPRPETECLVEKTLSYISQSQNARGLEIGLGSGAISLTLLLERPLLSMVATEVSQGALNYAEKSGRILLAGAFEERLHVLTPKDPLDVMDSIVSSGQAKFDFIVSNPPYLISSDEIAEDVLRHEPSLALFAPTGDPLYFYRKIEEQGRDQLKAQGCVFLEVPHERARGILSLFSDVYWESQLIKDLTGRDRVLVARLRGVIG